MALDGIQNAGLASSVETMWTSSALRYASADGKTEKKAMRPHCSLLQQRIDKLRLAEAGIPADAFVLAQLPEFFDRFGLERFLR